MIVPIPNDVLEDADYDIWEEIRPLCETAAMQAIDKAIIHGTNKPSSWPTAIAVDAAAKSHSVDLSTQIAAGEDMYDVLLGEDGIISLIEQDGYMATGHVASMSMRGKLRGVREKVYDGSGTANLGRSLFMPSMQGAGQYQLDGEPIVFPRNGGLDASSVLHIAGQWDQLVYSFRKEISYTMLTQSVIQDAGGNIIYNLAQQDMVALRMVLRMGWQLPNPPNYVNETASTRYPFAILVP